MADTSIWIDHLRNKNRVLEKALEDNSILMHPMIRGELALGSIKNRREFLQMLEYLPEAQQASNGEIFEFIEDQKLHSKGIGWVDISLIVSALLSSADLITLDKRLKSLWRGLK